MFVIDGIGTATPEHSISQQDAADIAQWLYQNDSDSAEGSRNRLHLLYAKAGVRTRHSVLLLSSTNGSSARQDFYSPSRSPADAGPTTESRMRRYEDEASPLAIRAASGALSDARYDPSEITHLITVSCSGFSAPGMDLAIIRELGLPPATQRTHVGFMGCHGALNALRVAQAFAAEPNARVLVCAVELCSLHHQYCERADQVVANALFADGAAAVAGRSFRLHDAGHSWQLKASGSTIIPQTEDFLSWHIRDHGFQMSLSPRLPSVIRQTLRPWLESWLCEQGFHLNEVQSWAIHPGGPKILQACASALDITDEHLAESEQVLSEFGNMSSPTVLFILERLRRNLAKAPCVMLAFGPGVAVEAALLVDERSASNSGPCYTKPHP